MPDNKHSVDSVLKPGWNIAYTFLPEVLPKCVVIWGSPQSSSERRTPVHTVVGQAGPRPQTHALLRCWRGGGPFPRLRNGVTKQWLCQRVFIQEQTSTNQHLLPVSTGFLHRAEGWASPAESLLIVFLCACSLHAWIRNTCRDSLHLTDSHKTNCQQTF